MKGDLRQAHHHSTQAKKDMSWKSMRHHFMSLLLDSIFEKLIFFQRDYFAT